MSGSFVVDFSSRNALSMRFCYICFTRLMYLTSRVVKWLLHDAFVIASIQKKSVLSKWKKMKHLVKRTPKQSCFLCPITIKIFVSKNYKEYEILIGISVLIEWEPLQIAIGSAVTAFLHWKWDLYPPLIIQAVNQPYALLYSPLAKIHLFQQRAWGKLRRPWTDNNALTMDSQWKRWNGTINSAISGDASSQTRKALKGKEKAKKGSTKKKQ